MRERERDEETEREREMRRETEIEREREKEMRRGREREKKTLLWLINLILDGTSIYKKNHENYHFHFFRFITTSICSISFSTFLFYLTIHLYFFFYSFIPSSPSSLQYIWLFNSVKMTSGLMKLILNNVQIFLFTHDINILPNELPYFHSFVFISSSVLSIPFTSLLFYLTV